MDDAKKLEMLEDMLELDAGALKPDMELASLPEWDSIALISFIALMDDEFDKIVKGKDIREMKTVADVMAVMEE